MERTTNRPLLVLNASAGSGKTYNLVRNYLVLLLSDKPERTDLGQIIAMTFTNKAAFEMKTRIIRDLSRLANPTESDFGYVTELSGLTDKEPDELQKSARLVLKKMLHRYEEFNVMTIDKFNLRLIRSFSRDLNLPEQFEVVLDEQLILEKAVDELLNTIDKDDQNRLYDLAINFAKRNLDDEARWDVKKALLNSAEILKDERSFQVIRSLIGKELTQADYDLWRLQLKEYKLEIQEWQRRIQLAVEASGLQLNDFHFGKNTWNKLQGMIRAKGTAAQLNEAFEATDYYSNNLRRTEEKTGQSEPAATVFRFWDYWTPLFPKYFELELKIKQFYLLSILRELAIYMEDIRQKDAVIRISEFNKLVAELVRDEEAPFIYERLGSRFRHFFLDEFQDTSRLQWMNLIPLVHESLASRQFNFIVGDPKQSIYRFKNGVAEQFVALPGIYNPENDPVTARKSTYFQEMGTVDGLTENWRSAEEIVRFNNRFFEALKAKLPESGKPYYNQIEQHPRGKAKGLVTYELFPKDEETDDAVFTHLLTWVQQCLQDGYLPSDICILAKRKSECNAYANYLKLHGYQVVSSDSLLVDSDHYVQCIIAFCRWRNHPNHLQLAMRFAELYFRLFEPEDAFGRYQLCFETIDGKQRFSVARFLELSTFDAKHLSSSFQDIFSLVQTFIRAYNLDELKNAYVHQLLDLAAQFDLHSGPDLAGFIAFYDKNGRNTNVQLPENKHSIKVMTAHKSKGLEFPVVLLPSVKFDGTGPNKKAYLVASDDHFVQTTLTAGDASLPVLAPLVEQEKDAAFMDSVNLLYVAFTRAVDRLYFMGVLSRNQGKLQQHIVEVLTELYPGTVDGKVLSGIIGEAPAIAPDTSLPDVALTPVSLNNYLWFPDISIMSIEEQEENELNRQKRFGRQFHAIMEQSFTEADALESIEKGLLKGTIDLEFREALDRHARKLFANEQYRAAITGGLQLDERTLLIDDKTRLRPDKIVLHDGKTIVIDFKTGERKPEHLTQVANYVFALELMKYPEIEGYLYYVNEEALVKVRTGS